MMSTVKLVGLVTAVLAVALLGGCSGPKDDAADVATPPKAAVPEPTAKTKERAIVPADTAAAKTGEQAKPAPSKASAAEPQAAQPPAKLAAEKPKQPAGPSAQPPAETKRPGKSGASPASAPKPVKPAGPAPLIVTGQVVKVSNVPEPGTAPYTECLTYLKYKVLSVESGEYKPGELLAVYWGMRKNKLMPAAKFGTGQTHKMTLEPFSKHPELQRVMEADDTEEYGLEPYWVVK